MLLVETRALWGLWPVLRACVINGRCYLLVAFFFTLTRLNESLRLLILPCVGLPRIDHQPCCIDGLSALQARLVRDRQALIDGINISGEMLLNKVRIIICL